VTAEERARMRSTLRQALGRALLPGAGLTHPGSIDALIGKAADTSSASRGMVDRFRTELTALGGDVHEANGPDDTLAIVHRLVAREPAPKVLMWEDHALPVSGLRNSLLTAAVAVTTQTSADMQSIESRSELATCTVGITGADAGLSETGSIVLVSGPGRGRLASLLPPVHIALLRRDSIVTSLPFLIASRPELVTSGANFVCITGPSRTADIEHTLSRGVHGPKEIHVVVI